MDKYSILSSREAEETPEADISLALESSLILSGTKYPAPRTRATFNFIATSPLDVVRRFFITISRARPNGVYIGFDASEECVVLSTAHLEVGQRYSIYGRLRRGRPRTVHCMQIEELCCRRLCYEMF